MQAEKYVLELLDWLKWYLERQEALKSSNFWQWRHLFIDIFVMLQSTLPNVGKASQTTVAILRSIAKLPLY